MGMGNTIWHSRDGKMVKIGKPHGRVENSNYLITCNYGDWSCFMTLAECEARIPELEKNMADGGSNKGDFFYIMER